MNPEKDVLILLESSGEGWQEINRGLLCEGARISTYLGGSLMALALGGLVEDREVLEGFGTSRLYLLKGEVLSEYRCEVYSWAIGSFLQGSRPRLFLLAHSDVGQELAPRVATQLGTAAVMDCWDIKVKGQRLSFLKPIYGDRFEQEVSFRPGLLEVATIRPGVLNGERRLVEATPLEVKEIYIEVPLELIRTRHLGVIAPDYRSVDIVYARRIIGTGYGAVDEEILPLVQELAQLLEGSLGATRPVVDEGHLPKERMIGQTGRRVAPELYIALGISGSPHHVAGFQESHKVISINTDPRAPIFQFSDIGFIGDLRGVLPRLIERIKQWIDSNEGV